MQRVTAAFVCFQTFENWQVLIKFTTNFPQEFLWRVLAVLMIQNQFAACNEVMRTTCCCIDVCSRYSLVLLFTYGVVFGEL